MNIHARLNDQSRRPRWSWRRKCTAARERDKLLDCARFMPPKRNWDGSMPFDVMRSEVAAWLVAQPQVQEWLMKTVCDEGLVVYDAVEGLYQGKCTAAGVESAPAQASSGPPGTLDCARTMPALSWSEAVEWLLGHPRVRQRLFESVSRRGLIVYAQLADTWRGRDFGSPGCPSMDSQIMRPAKPAVCVIQTEGSVAAPCGLCGKQVVVPPGLALVDHGQPVCRECGERRHPRLQEAVRQDREQAEAADFMEYGDKCWRE